MPVNVKRNPNKLFSNFWIQSLRCMICVKYSITAVADFPKKYIAVINKIV